MSDPVTMGLLMKILGGSGGMGGNVGTAQEPYNPAAKLAANPSASPQGGGMLDDMMKRMMTPGDAPPAAPPQAPQSFGGMMGQAMFPQTMKAAQGKGG